MREDKTQLVKYAMQYGLLFGIYWLISFALTITRMQILVVISNWLTLGIPFLAYWFTIQYRKKALDNQIGVFHAWQFGMMLYFYASLIISIPEYLYFQYVISPNDFILQFLQTVQPVSKEVESMKTMLSENTITPISATIQSIFTIIFLGIILSIPVAFIAKKKKIGIFTDNSNKHA